MFCSLASVVVCRRLSSVICRRLSFVVVCRPACGFTRAGQAMTSCRLQSNYCSTVTLHCGPVVSRPFRATPSFKSNAIITACTVVQSVVKANSQSNGKGKILTPWGSETPERISIKLGIYNHVAGIPTRANPCGAATTWVVLANT